jgi:hypothetical protein
VRGEDTGTIKIGCRGSFPLTVWIAKTFITEEGRPLDVDELRY